MIFFQNHSHDLINETFDELVSFQGTLLRQTGTLEHSPSTRRAWPMMLRMSVWSARTSASPRCLSKVQHPSCGHIICCESLTQLMGICKPHDITSASPRAPCDHHQADGWLSCGCWRESGVWDWGVGGGGPRHVVSISIIQQYSLKLYVPRRGIAAIYTV